MQSSQLPQHYGAVVGGCSFTFYFSTQFHNISLPESKQQTKQFKMAPANINNNQLIVDFPTASASGSAAKLVRFDSHVKGRFIEYPSSRERIKMWYTDEDYLLFKRQMTRDAAICSLLLADMGLPTKGKKDNRTVETLLIRSVGLNHVISRDVSQRAQDLRLARKNHAIVVLEEQKRQVLSGMHSVETLAVASAESSNVSRKKAYKFAKLAGCIL
jgi:hypothetical protein